MQRALELLLTTPVLCVLTGVALLAGSLWLASGFFKSSVCRRMNLKQRWVVCLAGFAGFAMLLYPPWIVTDQVWDKEALDQYLFPAAAARAARGNRPSEDVFTRDRSGYAPFYIWHFQHRPQRRGRLYSRPGPVRWHPLKQPIDDGYVVVAWTCRLDFVRLLLQLAVTAAIAGGLTWALRDRTGPTEVTPEGDWERCDSAAGWAIHKH